MTFGAGLGRREAQSGKWIRLTDKGRQAKFFAALGFAALANLRFGVRVVGVDQFLAARLAMRPEDSGIAAAVIPVDAALGRERIVLGAGLFFAFPAAGVLVHFLLSFLNRALGLRGEFGLQPGIGGGEFGVLRGLLKPEKRLGGCHGERAAPVG